MRTYIIDPPFEMFGRDDERTSAAINLIADLVFVVFDAAGTPFNTPSFGLIPVRNRAAPSMRTSPSLTSLN